MTTVVQLRSGQQRIVTKQQLAAHLGRSMRWIELRVVDGMPCLSGNDRYGRRRFDLTAVEAWLAGGRAKTPSVGDRVAELERQVAELAAQLSELRRTA